MFRRLGAAAGKVAPQMGRNALNGNYNLSAGAFTVNGATSALNEFAPRVVSFRPYSTLSVPPSADYSVLPQVSVGPMIELTENKKPSDLILPVQDQVSKEKKTLLIDLKAYIDAHEKPELLFTNGYKITASKLLEKFLNGEENLLNFNEYEEPEQSRVIEAINDKDLGNLYRRVLVYKLSLPKTSDADREILQSRISQIPTLDVANNQGYNQGSSAIWTRLRELEASLGADKASLTARVSALSAYVDVTKVLLADQKVATRAVEDQLNAANADLALSKQASADLTAKIEDLLVSHAQEKEAAKSERAADLAALASKHELEMQSLRDKLDATQATISEQAARLATREQELTASEAAVLETKNQLGTLQLENNALKVEITTSKESSPEEIARLTGKLDAQGATLQTAQTEAAELLKQVDGLQTTNARLQKETDQLKKEAAGLKSTISSLRENVRGLKREMESLQKTLSNQLAISEKDKTRIGTLKDRATRLQSESAGLIKQIKALMKQGDVAIKEASSTAYEIKIKTKTEIAALEGRLAGLTLNMKGVTEQLAVKERALATSMSKAEELARAIEGHLAENQALRESVVHLAETHKEEKTTLLSQLDESATIAAAEKNRANALQSSVRALQVENGSLLTENNALIAANASLKEEISGLTARVDELSAEVDVTKGLLAAQTAATKEVEGQLTTAMDDLVLSKKASDDLTAQIKALSASHAQEKEAAKSASAADLAALASKHELEMLSLRDKLDATQAIISEQAARLATREQELRGSEAVVLETKAQLGTLQIKNNALKAEITTSKESSQAEIAALTGKLDAQGATLQTAQTEAAELLLRVVDLQAAINAAAESEARAKEAHFNSILSQLKAFVAKTNKDKWKEGASELEDMPPDELGSKINGYQAKINAFKEQMRSIEPNSFNKTEYDGLLNICDIFLNRLNATLATKKVPLPSAPLPMPAPTPAPIPAAPPEHEPPVDKWKRFYAEHKTDTDEVDKRYTTAELFREGSTVLEEQGVLVAINMTYKDIQDEKIYSQFQQDASPVICPTSGQEYLLSFKGRVPSAILKKENAERFPDDTPEQRLQRRAATVINMIDNVLAKSEEIKITTTDPFLNEIANLYLKHLQSIKVAENKPFNIDVKDVKPSVGAFSDASEDVIGEAKTEAGKIFNKLKVYMPAEEIKQTPWFQDAVAFRLENENQKRAGLPLGQG